MRATLLRLLQPFEADGLWLPEGSTVEPVSGPDLPSPFRELLDHERDMTGTLEEHWGGTLSLRALWMDAAGDLCRRRVLLVCGGRPVGYGAIRIHLSAFSDGARARILEARTPLGAILRSEGLEHRCRPLGFLATDGDRFAREGLGTAPGARLFGRIAHLSGAGGRTLAEVVEVLPPVQTPRP